MRTIALVLVAGLVACGGDGGGTETVVDPGRLVIVSGDGQVGEVAPPPAASLEPRQVAPANVLPDTLVARIEGDTSQVSVSSTLTGPGLGLAAVSFPAGTSVEYVAAEGCGRPYIASVAPDTAGYVRTLWERPTGELPLMGWHDGVWGTRCEMEARSKVGNEFRADTTFVATFTPGPARWHYVAVPENYSPLALPERGYRDDYGNPVPYTAVVGCCATVDLNDMADFPHNAPRLHLTAVGEGAITIHAANGGVIVTGTLTVWDTGGGVLMGAVTFDR